MMSGHVLGQHLVWLPWQCQQQYVESGGDINLQTQQCIQG
jgi:hypothetical protein